MLESVDWVDYPRNNLSYLHNDFQLPLYLDRRQRRLHSSQTIYGSYEYYDAKVIGYFGQHLVDLSHEPVEARQYVWSVFMNEWTDNLKPGRSSVCFPRIMSARCRCPVLSSATRNCSHWSEEVLLNIDNNLSILQVEFSMDSNASLSRRSMTFIAKSSASSPEYFTSICSSKRR